MRKLSFSSLLLIAILCLLSGCSPPVLTQQATDSQNALESSQPVVRQIAAKSYEFLMPFEVHFIDVGQADAALVVCEDHAMLIDGGNAADSSLVYTYLKNYGVSHLDYIVCTHAHEDHVGGLAGALNYATVDTAFCPVTKYDTKAFKSFVKYLDAQDVTITVPSAGDTFTLGAADVQIVGPISTNDNPNNTSIVCRIEYGETSFLFTGDAEREEELEIIEAGYELQSTVLKVGHHGSNTSTTYPFLYMAEPTYAVISVGADNSYGHPTDATLSKLRDADVTVYRTDQQGTIICRSDGKSVTFTTEKKASAGTSQTTKPQAASAANYVLNTRSKKFHVPTCNSVDQMSPKNRKDFTGTRDEVIKQGYDPCGSCKP